MSNASFYLISKILIFLLPAKLIKYLYSILAAQLFCVLQLAYEVISKNTHCCTFYQYIISLRYAKHNLMPYMQKSIECEALFIMLTFTLSSASTCKKEEPQFEYTPFPLEEKGLGWFHICLSEIRLYRMFCSLSKRTHVDVL